MTTSIPAVENSAARWENEGGPARLPEMQPRDELETQLKRYDIKPVQLTVFDWGGYRYTNSRDAIAAAKRGATSA